MKHKIGLFEFLTKISLEEYTEKRRREQFEKKHINPSGFSIYFPLFLLCENFHCDQRKLFQESSLIR